MTQHPDPRLATVRRLIDELADDSYDGFDDAVKAMLDAIDFGDVGRERVKDLFALLMAEAKIYDLNDGSNEEITERIRNAIAAVAENDHATRCTCCRARRAS